MATTVQATDETAAIAADTVAEGAETTTEALDMFFCALASTCCVRSHTAASRLASGRLHMAYHGWSIKSLAWSGLSCLLRSAPGDCCHSGDLLCRSGRQEAED